MIEKDYSEAGEIPSNRQRRTDQWIAFLGSAIPVAVVLGVVVFEFFISFTGILWLATRMKFSSHPFQYVRRHPLFWPLSAWFMAVIASRLINGGPAYNFAHDIAFLRYPLFVAAMVDVAGRFPVRRYLATGLMIGVAYAGLNFLSAHLIGYDFLGKPLDRYVGKLKEGARIGALCAYAAPILFIRAMVDRPLDKRMRYWIVGLGLTAMTLLIGTRVRTALIAALVGWLATGMGLLVIRKRINTGIILALIVAAGLGIGGIFWFQPNLDSLFYRIYIWNVSFHAWLQNPVFGAGISSFGDAFRQVTESGIVAAYVSPTGEVFERIGSHHAHNIFLQILVCNGILGLGAFLWTFIKASLIAWRLGTGRHAGLLSWSFICLTIGLAGWNIYDPFYTTVVFFFLATISVSKIDGNDVEPNVA